MGNEMKKKFGLITAIAMVVGIVIGSGVFFKAGKVLSNTNGSMIQTLGTVVIVGVIMLICSYVFSILANRYEKVNGVVDYAEVALGPTYGYYVGWFLTVIYYPTLTATLAWVSAQYTCSLFGWGVASSTHVAVGAFFLLAIYGINALSPKLAGKFQVSTTVIKLIPLILMGVVGLIVGLAKGMTIEAFSAATNTVVQQGGGMMAAIVAFSFSYEGWIIATSINSELKDSKKNLPIALVVGALIVIGVYVLYFIGLTGAMSVPEMVAAENLPKQAFTEIFGSVAGTVVFVFIVISCLGTTNGLMLGCTRGAYSLAARGEGIAPKTLAIIDPETNMSTNSSIVGLLLSGLWYFYWQVCFIEGKAPALINWEPDELPIITLYAAYIPMFISLMVKEKDLGGFKRFVMPALGVASCCFMVFCAIKAYGIQSAYYLIVFAIIMALGFVVKQINDRKKRN